MDPLDDFEFKPLTDGLGFHKKKSAAPAEVRNAPMKQTPAAPVPMATLAGLENLNTPLPRKKNDRARTIPTIEDEISPGNSAVDEILQTLNRNRDLDFVKSENKIKAPAAAAVKVEASIPSLMAAVLDSMLIIAASLMCLIVMLTVTKVDLLANLNKPDTEGMVYLSTAALFLAVTFIYMIVHRVFMGATPGEWAFDQQVGTDEQIKKPFYTFKVAARIILNMATGFVILPILSLLFDKDLAGSLTGTSMIKKA